jgi:hypothetical protein
MSPTTPQATAPAGGGGATARAGRRGPVRGLTPDLQDGKAQAAALRRTRMPIYVPRLIMAGSQYCTATNPNCTVQLGQTTAAAGVPSGYPRAYVLHDPEGAPYLAYRMTLEVNPVLGEYYGIQGTTWQHPPILNKPTQTRMVAGKQLLLYANGGKLSLVAWRTSAGVYWVSNTLNDAIGNRQMVAIAASLTRP